MVDAGAVAVTITIDDCPVCLGTTYPPIRPCYNGHVICPDCYRTFWKMKIRHCPVCRGRLHRTRDLDRENEFYKTITTCKFRDEGCQYKSKGRKVIGHQKVCKYGPQNNNAENGTGNAENNESSFENSRCCNIITCLVGLSYISGVIYGVYSSCNSPKSRSN